MRYRRLTPAVGVALGVLFASGSGPAEAQGFQPYAVAAYRALAPVVVSPFGAAFPLLTFYGNGRIYSGFLGANGPVAFNAPSAVTLTANPEAEQPPVIGAASDPPAGSTASQFGGNGTVWASNDSVRITANGNLYGSRPIPRTSDTFEARIEKDDRLYIRWAGEPSAVAGITFALLDKNRRVIRETRVSKPPAEARFTLTSRTAYYQVFVEYVNGTTTSVISPL
jgi:hypothetical protein